MTNHRLPIPQVPKKREQKKAKGQKGKGHKTKPNQIWKRTKRDSRHESRHDFSHQLVISRIIFDNRQWFREVPTISGVTGFPYL